MEDVLNHPLYQDFRSAIILCLKSNDTALGSGPLRLQFSEQDLESMVTTPRKSLQFSHGVEAFLRYGEKPQKGNYQPLTFQIFQTPGDAKALTVLAYAKMEDEETNFGSFTETSKLASALEAFVPKFVEEAKPLIEYKS